MVTIGELMVVEMSIDKERGLVQGFRSIAFRGSRVCADMEQFALGNQRLARFAKSGSFGWVGQPQLVAHQLQIVENPFDVGFVASFVVDEPDDLIAVDTPVLLTVDAS